MPIALNEDIFQDDNVDGFIEYIANIITGYAKINHQYLDRSLNRSRVENRRGLDPNRNFITLEDAFDGYYWPTPDGGFELNHDVLEGLKGRLRDARMHGDEVEIYNAMKEILWWGAGNRRANLYISNKEWLDQYIARGNQVSSLLDNVVYAFRMDPFDEDYFDNVNARSNAGFTKVYALAINDFIIYDSRVAAAFGLLVINYCMQRNIANVPDHLRFTYMNAAGNDSRNPSRGNYIFQRASNHALHARSNWTANIVIQKAVDRLNDAGRLPGWVGHRGEALRRIEAALFMLGKDIPPPQEGVQQTLDYDIQLRAVQSGADDDAGWSVLTTHGRGVEFIWRRNMDGEDIEFRYGAGNGHLFTLDDNVIQRISDSFGGRGWFPIGSSHLNCEDRAVGSLGRWLCEDVGITLNIASYVASWLVAEGHANYRVSTRRGELEIIE